MQELRQVAITGMGVVSPFGIGLDAFWQGLETGASGIKTIPHLLDEELKVKYGGLVAEYDLSAHFLRLPPKTQDRALEMAYLAALEALTTSGLADADHRVPPEHSVATIIGTGQGTAYEIEAAMKTYFLRSVKAVNPMTIPRCMYNSLSSNLSIHFGLRGSNHVIVSACAAATCAIGDAYRLIKYGIEDAVLCGGTEAPLCTTSFCAWNRMRVLAYHDEPAHASRPFDANRNGLVLGEGAAMLVLESLEKAQQRGATVLARIVGYGGCSDATHITVPEKSGMMLAMHRGLADAGITPAAVDYVNAHGTATQLNDQMESEAVDEVFAGRQQPVPISSIKSSIGHALGASGALEAIATISAIRNNFLPPTINCHSPIPSRNLDFVPIEGRPCSVHTAMSNTFAFGGNNTCLVFQR